MIWSVSLVPDAQQTSLHYISTPTAIWDAEVVSSASCARNGSRNLADSRAADSITIRNPSPIRANFEGEDMRFDWDIEFARRFSTDGKQSQFTFRFDLMFLSCDHET